MQCQETDENGAFLPSQTMSILCLKKLSSNLLLASPLHSPQPQSFCLTVHTASCAESCKRGGRDKSLELPQPAVPQCPSESCKGTAGRTASLRRVPLPCLLYRVLGGEGAPFYSVMYFLFISRKCFSLTEELILLIC